jgi:ankyrin repeat protein
VSNHFEIIKFIVKWQPEVNVNETSECAAIPDLVATPLHFAAVGGDVATVGGPKRGHVEAVQELLEHPKLDVNAEDNKKMTPLLYAIEARNVDMVKVLCQKDKFDRLRATRETSDGRTPWQIVVEDKSFSENPNMEAIEKVLSERLDVKNLVDGLYRDMQMSLNAINALLVGASLIASVTFAGWLQPPLGYTPYYDFSQPFPAPPGAYESYAAIKQNPKVKVFWVFNSLSFFFAIATVLAGADAAMPSLDDAFIGRVVKSVRTSLIWASILLVMSVVCVLGAFASGGFAVLPPLLKYDTSMIITVCVGGTVCMIILAKFLWKLAKASRVRLLKRAMKHCTLVEGGHCSPTCIGNGS